MTFSPSRIVSTISSVNSWFWSNLVLSTSDYAHEGLFLFEIMSTWQSVQLGVCLLGFCPLASLATWHSAHVILFLLLVLSTLLYAHVWFCLLGSLSNWVFVYLNSVHLWSLATWHSAQVGLSSHFIQSTLGAAHVWLWLLWSQSNWKAVYLNSVYFGRLATWHSLQIGLCPLLVLATLDCAHFRFCLLWSQSTLVVIYFESVHLGVGTHDSQSSKFSAREKDFQIPFGSPFVLSFCESVQLGVCLSRFCPLWSPATWHSLQIGLCPLLVLSTLDFAHV